MKRAKNGRFIKNPNIQFDFPEPYAILKYIILLVVFLPWIYFSFYKFDALSTFENFLNRLFGPNECTCPNSNKPY